VGTRAGGGEKETKGTPKIRSRKGGGGGSFMKKGDAKELLYVLEAPGVKFLLN